MKIYFYLLLTLSLPFLFLGFGCTSTPSNSTAELSGTLSIRYLNKGQIIRAEAKLFVKLLVFDITNKDFLLLIVLEFVIFGY